MSDPRESQTLLAYGAIVVTALSLGVSAVFVRWANVPGVVSGFYREAFGFAVLVPFFVIQQRRRAHHLRAKQGGDSRPALSVVGLALLAGLFFAGDLGTWNTALFHTSAANATLLANLAPVFVGVGALVIFRVRLGRLFWLGLVVALAGGALMVGEGLRRTGFLGAGDLLAFSAAIFYGAYQLTVSRVRLRGMDSLTVSWLANISSGVALLALSVALGHALSGFSTRQWLSLVALGVIPQALGYVCMNYALGKLPAPVVSASLLGQPVVTALVSIPLLGEGLSLMQIVGGLTALIGIFLVNRSRTGKLSVDKPETAAALSA